MFESTRRTHSCALMVFALTASSFAVTTPLNGQDGPSADEFSTRLDTFVRELMALDVAPGLSVSVVREDETLFEGGYGFADLETRQPVTPETVFYIASSTKSFTGMAAATLHERGELDLDASLASMLPGVQLGEGLDPEAITLRDLLTHTHGIENMGPVSFRAAFSGDHTPELMLELLSAHGPAEDGRNFEYGNIGYNIASLAMDAHLGMPWQDVLRREVFDPLAMRSTSARLSEMEDQRLAMPHGAEPDGFVRTPYFKSNETMHAAGGMVTTATDMARWLRVNLNEGRLGSEQILDPEAVAAAHRPHTVQDNTYMDFGRTGYGLGWNTGDYDGESFTHHFGGFSGFHAHVSFMPEQDLGVVVLVNTAAGSVAATLIARYAYDLLRDVPDMDQRWGVEMAGLPAQVERMREGIQADRERRAARPQDLPYPLDRYVGVFENAEIGRIEISLSGDALHARIGRMESAVEVYDNTRNMLRVELTGGGSVMPVEFDDGAERASRLIWMSRRFERVPG